MSKRAGIALTQGRLATVFLAKADQKTKSLDAGVVRRCLAHESSGAETVSSSWIEVASGAQAAAHTCSSSEESIYVVTGELEFTLGNRSHNIASGDGVLIPVNVAHGYSNNTANPAQLITFRPSAQPSYGEPKPGAKNTGRVALSKDSTIAEFFPNIMRHEIVGAWLGAGSTNLTKLVFEPGAKLPNHHHPTHEALMVCIEGELELTYGDCIINAHAGDALLAKPKILHSLFNRSKNRSSLLAIHPVLVPSMVVV